MDKIQSSHTIKNMNNIVFRKILKTLGKGETEILTIVNCCLDKTFSQYLIITDDTKVCELCSYIKMKSINICDFLRMGVEREVITSGKYRDVIKELYAYNRISKSRFEYCNKSRN